MGDSTQPVRPTDGAASRPPGMHPPCHERWLLLLVALAALTPIYVVSSQDVSRLCLSRAVLAGRLTVSPCVGHSVDQAHRAGRTYSDKAPGMAFLAIPAVAATRLGAPSGWNFGRDVTVWVVRLLSGGLGFLAVVFLVGRVAEGLGPGRGGLALVTFALGTLVGPLAATTFDHVTTAALVFGAFVAAWHRRPALAGLLGGIALTFEYEAAIVTVIVGIYVARHGLAPLARYVAGALPGAAAIAWYDRAAFGSPLRTSYDFVSKPFAARQARGLFGISLPAWHSVDLVLAGDRGLLVASPVTVAAVAGLVLLAREHRAEALVCLGVLAGFLLLEFGYFLPYGGVSPGPRFLVPALPFLAVGLAVAAARFPATTIALALPSVIASTTLALTWSWGSTLGYRQTVWGELARALVRTNRRLEHDLAANILNGPGLGNRQAAVFVGVCALAAFALAAWPRRAAVGAPRERPR